jgi:FkbM family methyltransferase
MGCDLTVFGGGMLGAVAAAMNSDRVEIDGFLWPSRDTETRSSVFQTMDDLAAYVALCKEHRTVIQAGGNVGIWPKELSRHFAHVFTFEPDSENFACLQRNVREENVTMFEAGLGDIQGWASIARDPSNCGASALATISAKAQPKLPIPIMTIDGLELDDVDLLQLDVEGFELQALKGAAATIARCRPVIVVELKGLGTRFGYTDQDLDAWLKTLGYSRTHAAHRDVVYQHTERL